MVLQIMEPGQAVNVDKTKKTTAVGIDLGTTHSLVTISDGEEAKILEINQNSIVPSIVALVEEEFRVGKAAKTLQKNGHEAVVSSVKRRLIIYPLYQEKWHALRLEIGWSIPLKYLQKY